MPPRVTVLRGAGQQAFDATFGHLRVHTLHKAGPAQRFSVSSLQRAYALPRDFRGAPFHSHAAQAELRCILHSACTPALPCASITLLRSPQCLLPRASAAMATQISRAALPSLIRRPWLLISAESCVATARSLHTPAVDHQCLRLLSSLRHPAATDVRCRLRQLTRGTDAHRHAADSFDSPPPYAHHNSLICQTCPAPLQSSCSSRSQWGRGRAGRTAHATAAPPLALQAAC